MLGEPGPNRRSDLKWISTTTTLACFSRPTVRTTAKFGFLFFRDRKAWAAETLENARAGLPAMRHSLDPMLLDRLSDTAQGERRFEYVGQVPRR
jgi:hypothetical protein